MLNTSSLLALKMPQKRSKIAVFMPSVVIGGNKVVTKKPLITTCYPLIVNELSVSVVNVVLN